LINNAARGITFVSSNCLWSFEHQGDKNFKIAMTQAFKKKFFILAPYRDFVWPILKLTRRKHKFPSFFFKLNQNEEEENN
jgi:hypothetical protein